MSCHLIINKEKNNNNNNTNASYFFFKKKTSHSTCGGPIWLGQEGRATDITKKLKQFGLFQHLWNGKNGGAKGKRSVVVIGIGERMRSKSGRGGRPKLSHSTSSSPSITTTSLPMPFNHKHNQVCFFIHIFVLFFYICLTLQFYNLYSFYFCSLGFQFHIYLCLFWTHFIYLFIYLICGIIM